MKLDIKQNWPLVVGISVPLLMIIIVAVSIYLPALFAQPKFNFIYLVRDNKPYDSYYCSRTNYTIKDGHIVEQSVPTPQPMLYPYNNSVPPVQPICNNSSDGTTFYFYNVAQNQSYEIPFSQASQYLLDTSSESPDGYSVQNGSGGGDPFFGGGYNNYGKMYLKGHNISKQLNLQGNTGSYGSGFQFEGWIVH